jgi:UDP-N-acetylmuramoyl-tripeptide--D-alanyl-D-alanine ligase
MIRRTIRQTAKMCGSDMVAHDAVITGVSTDTRDIRPGNLFVPLEGPNYDAHKFVLAAFEKGAAAAMWEIGKDDPLMDRPLIFVRDTLCALQKLAGAYRRELKATVVGVTGSNGKTSAKDIAAGILSGKFRTQKTEGNLNNHIGVPLTLLSLNEDTEMAVIEMGMSAPGEIAVLSAMARPDIGVITNIGCAHLAQLGSLENIADAKLELAGGMRQGGLLILNGDQPLLAEKAASLSCAKETFGNGRHNTLYLTDFAAEADGISFGVSSAGFSRLYLPAYGRHQAVNALSGILTALHAGMTPEEIRQGLQNVRLTPHRTQIIRTGHTTLVDDAYKSNPESLRAALEVFYSLRGGTRKLFVMGDMADMGEASGMLHRQAAEYLEPERLDAVYAIGEQSEETIRSARLKFGRGKALHFEEREKLLWAIREYAKEPCMILFKASHALNFGELVESVKGGDAR